MYRCPVPKQKRWERRCPVCKAMFPVPERTPGQIYCGNVCAAHDRASWQRGKKKMAVRLLMTVDPGVEMGWALWDMAKTEELVGPLETGVIVPSTDLDWQERTDLAIISLENVFTEWNNRRRNQFIERVVCEYPTFMTSNKGVAAADSGSLVKLAVMAGRIMQISADYGAAFEFVEIAKWKGQLDKTTVIYRIKKRLGEEKCLKMKSHAFDAVGIGLHIKGFF